MRANLVLAILLTAAPVSAEPAGPSSIGVAAMAADGVITLRLRADEHGRVGEGLLIYRPGDKDYQMVLDHLGGLKPGEIKPVAPWPDR